MTAVNQTNWYTYLGKIAIISDNTSNDVYAGALLGMHVNPDNGVYELNISGVVARLVATDDVTVTLYNGSQTTVGIGIGL